MSAVRNRVLKTFEQENRYTPLENLLTELSYSSANADVLLLRDELRKTYEAILETLTPSQQTIIKLRYEQDLDTGEIARLMDISRKTVQNQLRTALLQIRTSLLSILLSMMMKNIF